MSDHVSVAVGHDESEQQGSFQNGTLQGIGDCIAVTVQTHLALPAELAERSQEEVAAYLQELLIAASNAVGNQLVFDVQLGASIAHESNG